MNKKDKAIFVYSILDKKFPNTGTFLTHKNPFELLIAVILSAQCTDERVNRVTPGLFKKFPTPEKLANGTVDAIRETIKSINFCNNKAINIKKTAEILFKKHNSKVPPKLNELVTLPGVGRKTANVVLGQAFNIPGITVDTHVKRVSNRLGFTKHDDPEKAEEDLMKAWPIETWINFSSIMILHGRQTCKAQKPLCGTCEFQNICTYNKKVSSAQLPA